MTDEIKSANRYRWAVWGSMVLAYMVVFFHRLAAGVVRADITEAFNLTPSAFGSMASAYFYAYMVMQIPVGMMADSLGARMTVSIGMLLAGTGSIVFGMAPTPFWLLAGRFLVGIGVSTVFVSILKIQSQWFREREFGTMSGLTSFVGNMGGVLAQAPLALLVGIFSWRASFVTIGLGTLLIALLCWAVIRNKPEDKGYPSISEQSDSKKIAPLPLVQSLKISASNWRIWPVFVFFGCYSGVYLAFSGTWGTPYLQDVYHMTVGQASSIVSYAVYGTILGGLSAGTISDKLGLRKTPLVVMNLVATLVWLAIVVLWKGMPPVMALRPLFFMAGFSATSYVISWAIIKEINHPQSTGVAIALVNTGAFLGSALITTFMGRVLENLSHLPPQARFTSALWICLGATVLGLVCSFFFPETRCRNTYSRP
ncbi:MAG: MFS transporter [Synergistales bacterium]|nr:MFS transporter [Synergistales bacterium]